MKTFAIAVFLAASTALAQGSVQKVPTPSVVVGQANKTGQTSTLSSLVSLTSPNDGNKHAYLVSGLIKVTAYTSGTITLSVTYTDHGGTSQTENVQLNIVGSGGFNNGASSATTFNGVPMYITTNPNTTITVKTTGPFSATYDVFATVLQLS
jgi:hypothetical protein